MEYSNLIIEQEGKREGLWWTRHTLLETIFLSLEITYGLAVNYYLYLPTCGLSRTSLTKCCLHKNRGMAFVIVFTLEV